MRHLNLFKDETNEYCLKWIKIAIAEEQLNTLYLIDRNKWKQELINRINKRTNESIARNDLVHKYAWAIPCKAALEKIKKYSPIIEIGAGSGYWAYLLKEIGVEIVASDINPPKENEEVNTWHPNNKCWTEIIEGGIELIERYPNHTLFLCWPPYNDPLAYNTLKSYKGKYFIFIGESEGGCTGDEKFFKYLEDTFEEIDTVIIPQYDGVHDYLTIYERK